MAVLSVLNKLAGKCFEIWTILDGLLQCNTYNPADTGQELHLTISSNTKLIKINNLSDLIVGVTQAQKQELSSEQ